MSVVAGQSVPGSGAGPGGEAVVDVHDAFALHPLPDGGAVAALRGLSLSVRPGERLVVHGPNGSGKTTLLRSLAGEQRLAAGRVTVAGLELSGATSRQLAAWRSRQLGQIDQDAGRLLRPEFDVLGNVMLQLRVAGVPRRQAHDRARDALDRLGLADLAERRPHTLSGGQTQRVAVCAAIAHEPAVVLADEPTGQLDAVSADAVYELLATAVEQAGSTLVMVTHDRRAQAVADRVVRIRDGRISETWHPDTTFDDAEEHAPDEALVVDDRGWIRLPLSLRERLGLPPELTVTETPSTITLRPREPLPAVPETARPVTDLGELREAPGGEPLAEVSGVTVAYDGRHVLGSPTSGFGLSVRPGEILVVAGRSGAGKRTVLRVLLGLQLPGSGQVRMAGTDLIACSRAEAAAVRARTCAVVLQQIQLAGTAAAESNLDLARAVRGLPSTPDGDREGLAELGLTGDLFVSGRPASGLSGGERQRLAVARALSVGPKLLVLDEPTSQLDEASAEQLAAVLVRAARSGTAIVIASHDPVLLAAATRTIELT